jgi:hypothetical protein
VRTAQRISFPVVTKTYNGKNERAISIRLTTNKKVKK